MDQVVQKSSFNFGCEMVVIREVNTWGINGFSLNLRSRRVYFQERNDPNHSESDLIDLFIAQIIFELGK